MTIKVTHPTPVSLSVRSVNAISISIGEPRNPDEPRGVFIVLSLPVRKPVWATSGSSGDDRVDEILERFVAFEFKSPEALKDFLSSCAECGARQFGQDLASAIDDEPSNPAA